MKKGLSKASGDGSKGLSAQGSLAVGMRGSRASWWWVGAFDGLVVFFGFSTAAAIIIVVTSIVLDDDFIEGSW